MKLALSLARITHNLFIPHSRNNYKAGLAHPGGLISLGIFLMVFQLSMQLLIQTPGAPKVLGYAANISVEEVIRLTNVKREENGLPPLVEDPALSASALVKGNHMLENDYWAHIAPDGTEPWFFIKQGGYVYRYAGENLARDFSDATSAVDAWMASPSHRENILSNKYRDIGIGVVEGDLDGVDSTIIVQFMGTRLSDSLPVAPLAQNIQNVETSPSPSSSPRPAEIAGVANPEPTIPVLISPFVTTKGVSVATVILLLIIFVIDAIITSRRRIRRTGGRVFAHIAFLGMILAIMLILRAGEVL